MKEKLCDTCRYRNNVEQLKPCIIYRDDCEYYEKERDDMTREEALSKYVIPAIERTWNDKICAKIKKTLEHSCIMCTECKNFEKLDNYCRMLQINFLPDEFGCNKGERK